MRIEIRSALASMDHGWDERRTAEWSGSVAEAILAAVAGLGGRYTARHDQGQIWIDPVPRTGWKYTPNERDWFAKHDRAQLLALRPAIDRIGMVGDCGPYLVYHMGGDWSSVEVTA